MPTLKKPALLAALLAGAALATAAYAQMGPGDGDGHGHGERGQRMLEMFDTIDANNDGKVTMDEIEAHRAAEFTAADTNGDGALDSDELTARQMTRMQERMATRVQHMIDNMDNDGNGSLSADELGRGPFENRFARIDTDNDGAISKEEAEAMLHHRKMRGMRGWGMQDE
jgi:Ca2+-binding EF-hand superfamily protein